MKVITKIINFILIIVFTVCIVSTGVIATLSSTILNKNYVMHNIEETNYYSQTYELVKSNFEKYIYQSGLDETALDDICSEEKIKRDTGIIISNIYDGSNEKIDTSEIADNLNRNIEARVGKDRINEKAVKQYIDIICEEYVDTIIHTKYEQKINDMYVKAKEILDIAYKVLLIALFIDLVLIVIVNIKNILDAINCLGIGMLAGGLTNILACYVVKSRIDIENIKIFNDIFSNLLVKMAKNIIENITTQGLYISAIGVILIVIFAIMKNNKKDSE